MHTTLLDAATLARHLDDPDWVFVDCRFSLADTEAGRRAYREAHIPGAVYAHLDEDLSGPIIPGKTGRHPLPPIAALAERFDRWGIGPGVQVVAYDDLSGAIAARLWWLLRWLGHDAVAVLDGGWPAWRAGGFPTTDEAPAPQRRSFTPRPRPALLADAAFVETVRHDPAYRVVDARTPERYRGEAEPIDPVAGHIPGAVNAPHPDNVDAEGAWRSPEKLRVRFEAVLGDVPPANAVFYCGSGVTACRNILAMEHAGLPGAKLYAGSWSEWIAQGEREVEEGDGQ